MNIKLFIIWLFPVFLMISVSAKAFAYNLSGTSWPDAAATYYSTGGSSNSTFNSAFVEAMNNWNTLSNFVFTNASGYKDPCWNPNNNPGGPWFNGWEFRGDLCGTSFGGSTLAVNIRWSSGSTIVQAGTIFNTAFTWDVHNGSGSNIDFRRVATHELGHALGLGHDNTFAALLNTFNSETIETPQTDDINGLRAIYGLCNYSISPASRFIGLGGGTGSISVSTSSGCPWTATSNSPWITITSGSSGNGNGTVNYSVKPNTSTLLREGSMTIAGLTYTITQNGINPLTTGDIDGNGQDEVIADFGDPYGLHIFMNNSIWIKLHPFSPETVTCGDIDGNGQDEVIADFGDPYGIHAFMNIGTWVKLHSLSPETMITGDMDGNGMDEVIIDFGDPDGLHIFMNNSIWIKLHPFSPETVTCGDMDGNGQKEVIADFGDPYGIHAFMNIGTWVKILN